MAQIIEFVRPDYVFDSEVAAVLVEAYDQAILGLHDKGQSAAVRQVIAKRIIKLAAAGERDPDKLSQAAPGELWNIALTAASQSPSPTRFRR